MKDWSKELLCEFQNCVVVICLGVLAFEALQWEQKEIALCVVSGLVGYLSKKNK